MNILILNWRDIKNPASGGAEVLTHELARGWVRAGHTVTVLSSKFQVLSRSQEPRTKNQEPTSVSSSSFQRGNNTEMIDGVRFIRLGTWWTVHIHAFFYYLKNRDKFDIVIDEVHWFPFFAKIYAREKTIALTCERATKLFPQLFSPIISHIFMIIEKIYFALYKRVPTMTISESTKKDLIAAGINRSQITVLPMGITLPKNLKKYPKEKSPTFIYLGRINKQKGIYDAILAFAQIRNSKSEIRNPKLWIIGSGLPAAVEKAKEQVGEYDLEKHVKFFGRVSEASKYELLAQAHILLVPSAHEGWGLTVPEASAVGTPAIVYNVAGLRDIVDNQETGIITKINSPDELSKEAVRLLRNKKLYKKLQKEGLKKVKAMNWKNTIRKSLITLHKFK